MSAASSVTVVNSHLEVEEKGHLFEGTSFFVAHRCPQRSRFVTHIRNNGGKVVALEKIADIFIGDHLRADSPPGSISYTWIEQCLATGQLEPYESHRAGRPTGEARPVGAAEPRKQTRTPFSQQDDEFLYRSVQDYRNKGGVNWKGNEVYKQIGQANDRHPWQAWRARYVQVLSLKPPVNVSRALPTSTTEQPPQVKSEDTEEEPVSSRNEGPSRINDTDNSVAATNQPRGAERLQSLPRDYNDKNGPSNLPSSTEPQMNSTTQPGASDHIRSKASRPAFNPPEDLAEEDLLFLRDKNSGRGSEQGFNQSTREAGDFSPPRARLERSESPLVVSHRRIDPTWRPRSLMDSGADSGKKKSGNNQHSVVKEESQSPAPYVPLSPLRGPDAVDRSASPMFLPEEPSDVFLHSGEAGQRENVELADANVSGTQGARAEISHNHAGESQAEVIEPSMEVRTSVLSEALPSKSLQSTVQSQDKSNPLLAVLAGVVKADMRTAASLNNSARQEPMSEAARTPDSEVVSVLDGQPVPGSHDTARSRTARENADDRGDTAISNPSLEPTGQPSKRRKSSLPMQGQRLSLSNLDLALDDVDISSFTDLEKQLLSDVSHIIQNVSVGRYNAVWREFADSHDGQAHSAAEWKTFYEQEILPKVEAGEISQEVSPDAHPISLDPEEQDFAMAEELTSQPQDFAQAELTAGTAGETSESSGSMKQEKFAASGSSQQNISRKRRRQDSVQGDGDQADESQYFSVGSNVGQDLQQSLTNAEDSQTQEPEQGDPSGTFKIFEYRDVDEIEQENLHTQPPSQHPYRESGEALQFTDEGIHFRLEPMDLDDDEEDNEDEDEDEEEENVTPVFAEIQEQQGFPESNPGIRFFEELDEPDLSISKDDNGQDEQRGDEDGFVEFDIASQIGENVQESTHQSSSTPRPSTQSIQNREVSPSPIDVGSEAESEDAFEPASPQQDRQQTQDEEILEIDYEVPGPPDDDEDGFRATDEAFLIINNTTSQTSSQKLTPVSKRRSLPWQAQAETQDTQAFFDGPTQLPDLTIPSPPDDHDDSASTPASEMLMPMLSPERPGSSHTDAGDAYIENFISQQEKRGFDANEALYALKRTTLNWELALIVLESMRAGKGVPQNVPGIWTEEEDKILLSGNAKQMRQLEHRHGRTAYDSRLDGLDELMEEDYDDDDDDNL